MSNEIILNSRINGLLQVNTALQNRINGYISQVSNAQQQISSLTTENNRLRQENESLKKDLERLVGPDYKSKLSKPFLDYAERNQINYKEAYEKQQEEIADWMVSQKAFKELAIEFGLEKGIPFQETIKMGVEKKIDVLEDKNNPSHNTNIDDNRIKSKYGEKFKKEIKEKLKKI